MDYESAFKRPFLDIKKLLIGILLSILPIINFFSLGYVLDAAKLTLKKKNDLPEWENWGELFVHGFLVFVIGIIYLLPSLILALLAVGSGILKWFVTKSALEGLETGGPLLIAAGLVMIVMVYVAPISMILYAKNWEFKEAFNFSEIIKRILTGKYFIVWIISMVLSVIGMGILSIVPIIGGSIASFITSIISMTLFAQVYNEVK
ncbi:DUF4013 domain-containing protein [Candidatus Woesearchaeota archaeon]|nr:DUF4013 domain-containing protein [Candidatus Woesearchaeota archaeon]